jgi:hypothetical protein
MRDGMSAWLSAVKRLQEEFISVFVHKHEELIEQIPHSTGEVAVTVTSIHGRES